MTLCRRSLVSWLGAGGAWLAQAPGRPARASAEADGGLAASGIPAQRHSMESDSMLPGIAAGDVILSDPRAAGRLPERGAIIIFRHRSRDGKEALWVKRVIGRPGDSVSFVAGRPVLNGEPLAWGDPRPVRHTGSAIAVRDEVLPGQQPYQLAYDNIPEALLRNLRSELVRPDHVFVVGDNRDHSLDSRLRGMGQVAVGNIVGRIVYRVRPRPGWLVPPGSVDGLVI
jgi:signal peptidase I